LPISAIRRILVAPLVVIVYLSFILLLSPRSATWTGYEKHHRAGVHEQIFNIQKVAGSVLRRNKTSPEELRVR
jgi:hypothetical protein